MRNFFLLFFVMSISACDWLRSPVAPVKESGELVVVTRKGPTTYYLNEKGEPAGFEYDLAKLFAQYLGVELTLIVADGPQDVRNILFRHHAHLGAAGLTNTPHGKLRFGPPYQTVRQLVIYNTTQPRPRGYGDLAGTDIEIMAGHLGDDELAAARERFPALNWREVQVDDSEELLKKVARGELVATIIDSNMLAVAKNFYPNVGAAFPMGDIDHLAWVFPGDADPFLFEETRKFFRTIKNNSQLQRLLDRYYGHVDRLGEADVSGFLEKMQNLLPRFKPLFKEAEEISGIDWRVLAALAYQESHWDPLATSPTNVRGIMMLTEETAERMGVVDRLQAKPSIVAGARYLALLRASLPPRISEPDRTWMAIAAYNVGLGHVEDARILAQRRGLSPDSWTELKKTLPLLSQDEHHGGLKSGYARGGEAVIMTENIRTYLDILSRFETKPFSPGFY
ncbi:MAG: membrane-bound lytic murein transglycosylase MltF [Burkholderiales bacterium]